MIIVNFAILDVTNSIIHKTLYGIYARFYEMQSNFSINI